MNRAPLYSDQPLELMSERAIEDPHEMNETLPNAVRKLHEAGGWQDRVEVYDFAALLAPGPGAP